MVKMTAIVESIDVLVHPGYEISKIFLRVYIDGGPERNILELRGQWLDSISCIAGDESRYLALVNGVNVSEEVPVHK